MIVPGSGAGSATAAGFDALVKGNYAPAASALAQAIDFGELGTVVDVGGGHGGFIIAILRAHRGCSPGRVSARSRR